MRCHYMLIAAALVIAACDKPQQQAQAPFNVVEATIPDMQKAMAEGRVTSRQLVESYFVRIAKYENVINATVAVNAKALEEADRLDQERAAGKVRGPLHGIPIAVKDNIHTTDMPTTGGAIAFHGLMVPYDASLVTNLREAGAVIIAKTVLTELANWVAGDPQDMPDNYGSEHGYAFNPYDPRRDPRDGMFDGQPVLSTGGSSNGSGTAASFWAASIGTETSGSILWPANQNRLAAIKPTLGRISRHGIIPITADQDSAGPMARTVTDAAVLMGVLEGRAPDPNDAATSRCTPPANNDYTAFLKADGLKGARIGIPRAAFYNDIQLPGRDARRPALNDAQKAVMEDAIAALKAAGAEIIDPVDIPSVVTSDPAANFFGFPTCSGEPGAKGNDANCSTVFKYGMKRDFNAWAASLGDAPQRKTLGELVAWNRENAMAGTIKYGQSNLEISEAMDLDADRARYEADRAKDISLSRETGIDAVMAEHKLDALLFPANRGAGIAAKAGYPSVAVPFGMVPNDGGPAFPPGFEPKPAPLGVTFTGRECSEGRLLELAYSFEQATKRRAPPPGFD